MHLGGVRVATVAVLTLCAFGCGLRGGKGDKARTEMTERMSKNWAHEVCDQYVPPGAFCGSIVEKVWSPASRKDFIVSVCREPFGPMSDDCRGRFNDMWLARLEETYRFADLETLNLHCRAYPKECGNPAILETWFRDAHNATVRAKKDEELKALEAKEEEERAETRRAIGEALANFGKDHPTVNCTSQAYGSTVHTSCQ